MRISFCVLFLILASACQTDFEEPKISTEAYRIQDGFEVKALASEPLLRAPVAMDFDHKGRIWVAEMTEFMSDIDGNRENEPTGSIKILEDLDKDGVMDHATVFLDSLVLPRALAFAYGGLLYAEPPFLWFVEIENDRPKNRVLVDSLYAAEGNPEHQPNGLMMNVDNWIYNAKSHFRYQKKAGKWIKEPTTFRGQWGISHDNFGRLYFNDNSRQLIGDYMLPNRLVRNQNHVPKSGTTELLTTDQRVYPLHAAAVNRGYAPGVLNKDSLLVHVTAACGPLVYRGGSFPDGYEQNVFVCVPEANLIKRNILTFKGDSVKARQAWEGKEFLASFDEGFRPVYLSNGPDGSLYIVDMHRGVIGHHAYLSPYLRKKAKTMQLDTIIDFGRILKVTKKGVKTHVNLDWDVQTGQELIALLGHKNGWIRDRAQQFLIHKKPTGVIPQLENRANDSTLPITQIHALHTLNAFDALSFDLLEHVARKSNPTVVSHVLVLLEEFRGRTHAVAMKRLMNDLVKQNDRSIDLYLASSIGAWLAHSEGDFLDLFNRIVDSYGNRPIFMEAILSGLGEVSDEVLTMIKAQHAVLGEPLSKMMENRSSKQTNPIFSRSALAEDTRTKGAKLFRKICSSCHGMGGEGIEGMAPPLENSEYVEEVKNLALIILHGLKGLVHVNGKTYEFNHAMPGLVNNQALTDRDISDIISYVSNAFSDRPRGMDPEKIKELRSDGPNDATEFTEKELLERIDK